MNETVFVNKMLGALHDQLTDLDTSPEDLQVCLSHSETAVKVSAHYRPTITRLSDTVEDWKAAHAYDDLQEIHVTFRSRDGYAFCRWCWHEKAWSTPCTNVRCKGPTHCISEEENEAVPMSCPSSINVGSARGRGSSRQRTRGSTAAATGRPSGKPVR